MVRDLPRPGWLPRHTANAVVRDRRFGGRPIQLFRQQQPLGTASSGDTRVGYTVGAGIEHKFTPNWSGKLEYLYMDFGTRTYFAGTANQADVSFRDHVLRAGINYEFAPGPVVAKY